MGIGEVSFFTGILLFFISIVGGGIDIKELKIPQITFWTRLACFLGGLLFLGMGLYLKNVISPQDLNSLKTAVSDTTSVNKEAEPAPTIPATVTEPVTTTVVKTDTPPVQSPPSTDVPTNTPPMPETPPPTDAELARDNAKKQFANSTKRLNAVWNAASASVRNSLSPEQLQWLRKRESDCAEQATKQEGADNTVQETIKYDCMAIMTEPRIDILKQEIASIIHSEASAVYDNAEAKPEEIELAKQQLDEANKRLNLVWNASSKEIRETLLPEQRQWLKQRENDCTQRASEESTHQEASKLRCMTTMTEPRIDELKQKIATLSQEQK